MIDRTYSSLLTSQFAAGAGKTSVNSKIAARQALRFAGDSNADDVLQTANQAAKDLSQDTVPDLSSKETSPPGSRSRAFMHVALGLSALLAAAPFGAGQFMNSLTRAFQVDTQATLDAQRAALDIEKATLDALARGEEAALAAKESKNRFRLGAYTACVNAATPGKDGEAERNKCKTDLMGDGIDELFEGLQGLVPPGGGLRFRVVPPPPVEGEAPDLGNPDLQRFLRRPGTPM